MLGFALIVQRLKIRVALIQIVDMKACAPLS